MLRPPHNLIPVLNPLSEACNCFHSLLFQDAYNNDQPAGTRRWLRRLMALPLVPAARIPAMFNAVVQAAPQIPQANDVHRYMTDTWINQQSTFPPDLWSMYSLVSIICIFQCIH